METKSFDCVKCSGPMIRGFLVDYSDQQCLPAYWVEGEPVNAKLFGLTGVNLDVRGSRKFAIRSLRCERCGFLESYAV